MDAGSDNFMTKPFDADQLTARIHVAERIIGLQRRVAEGARELFEKNEQAQKSFPMTYALWAWMLPGSATTDTISSTGVLIGDRSMLRSFNLEDCRHVNASPFAHIVPDDHRL